jgi:hypothetical protein
VAKYCQDDKTVPWYIPKITPAAPPCITSFRFEKLGLTFSSKVTDPSMPASTIFKFSMTSRSKSYGRLSIRGANSVNVDSGGVRMEGEGR